jgi:hypothetical protein
MTSVEGLLPVAGRAELRTRPADTGVLLTVRGGKAAATAPHRQPPAEHTVCRAPVARDTERVAR